MEVRMKEYTNSQMSGLIDEHIHNERDRDLLKRRLCDGLTFDCLSAEFGLSVQRTKTIVYQSVSLLIKYL